MKIQVRLLLYVTMAIAIWFTLSRVGPTNKYLQLSQAGVHSVAVVVRPDCTNHATIIYRFEVAGNQFESHDGASNAGKNCANVKPGDVLSILYLPTNPTVNTIGDPGAELQNERISVALVALFFPAFILWAYLRRRKSWKGT
ncbi:hypothetical protein [Collimonas fungivorans]|uniref:hypothetical protein n=1 Tax=Collimonas fungivorans TaxID=158899 RepID=UPI0011D1BA9E|nr:hypothetical protein [Collimonas fungivorans]